MGKFAMSCPNCGSYVTAYNGIRGLKGPSFGPFKHIFKGSITCGNCKTKIDVQAERMKSIVCPSCGNMVVYDQGKKTSICPVCHKELPAEGEMVPFACPSCAGTMLLSRSVLEDSENWTCPLCDTIIEKKEIRRAVEKDRAVVQNLISVVEFEGDQNMLVWKHPNDDFPNGSRLVVRESQVALFMKGGRVFDVLGPGEYTMNTKTLPVMKAAYHLNDDDPDVSFRSDVYFVSTATMMNIEWGTPYKVRVIDPLTHIGISIGAGGVYNIRITDPRRIVAKLVGTTKGLLAVRPENLTGGGTGYSVEEMPSHNGKTGYTGAQMQYQGRDISTLPAIGDLVFESIINCVRTSLAIIIREENINLMEIDAHSSDISERMRERVNQELAEYGVYFPQFYVNRFAMPDETSGDADSRKYAELRKKYQDHQGNKFTSSLERETELEKRRQHAEDREWEKQIKFEEREDEEFEREKRRADMVADADETAFQEKSNMGIRKMRAEGEADIMRTEARAVADVKRMETGAEADSIRMKGLAESDVYLAKTHAEAQEMKEKGYSYQDEASREWSREFLNKVDRVDLSNFSTSSQKEAGSMTKALEKVSKTLEGKDTSGKEVKTGNEEMKPPKDKGTWNCKCGKKGFRSQFCPDCGAKNPQEKKPVSMWNCSCGEKNLTSNWCPTCGKQKPESWNCECGEQEIYSPFCPRCGRAKPTPWNCVCGKEGLLSNCCPVCGRPKPEPWVCGVCGVSLNGGTFCPFCGARKEG